MWVSRIGEELNATVSSVKALRDQWNFTGLSGSPRYPTTPQDKAFHPESWSTRIDCEHWYGNAVIGSLLVTRRTRRRKGIFETLRRRMSSSWPDRIQLVFSRIRFLGIYKHLELIQSRRSAVAFPWRVYGSTYLRYEPKPQSIATILVTFCILRSAHRWWTMLRWLVSLWSQMFHAKERHVIHVKPGGIKQCSECLKI